MPQSPLGSSSGSPNLSPHYTHSYLGARGQRSDPGGPSYHPDGLPLEQGLVEVITEASTSPGQHHAHLPGTWERLQCSHGVASQETVKMRSAGLVGSVRSTGSPIRDVPS